MTLLALHTLDLDGEPLHLTVYDQNGTLVYEVNEKFFIYMNDYGVWDGDTEDKELVRRIGERIERMDD